MGELRTLPRIRVNTFDTTMSPPTNLQLVPKEAWIQLAIQALDSSQIFSLWSAVSAYNVPESSLWTWHAGTTPRRNYTPNLMKLTVTEEEAIKQYILKLDSRGFAPPLNAVWEMANKLLTEWWRDPVGINWPHSFIKCTPGLKTKYNQKLDYQHYKQEEPAII